jgi:hypothetical protein
MVALGSAAPAESVTVPVIAPVCCASTRIAIAASMTMRLAAMQISRLGLDGRIVMWVTP